MGTGPLRAIGGLGAPRPIRVITSPGGAPHAAVIDGRRRLVLAIRDDWLIQDRWWTDAPIERHYYELVIEPGSAVTVFRDCRSGTWLTHMAMPREHDPRHRLRR